MVLRAFPYPGGKGRHAEWIISQMADHERYVEPFCGSAAVFFNKEPVSSEVLNDVDGNIVHFFNILRDRTEELLEYLELFPFSYAEHERIMADYYDGRFPDDPVERAAEFYFLRYSQFGSKAKRHSGFARDGSSVQKSRAKSYVNSQSQLRAAADRLMDAVIDLSYDHDIEQRDWWSVSKKSRYAINRGGRENTEYLHMNYDPRQTDIVKPTNQTSIESFV